MDRELVPSIGTYRTVRFSVLVIASGAISILRPWRCRHAHRRPGKVSADGAPPVVRESRSCHLNDNDSQTPAGRDSYRQPYPWERQPGEPLDRYRWFQVYLTLPPPRPFKTVTRIVGLKPGSRLVARAARSWRWQERAAASDSPQDGCLALQVEWRNQLIREAAYLARFVSLQDSNRALSVAAIGKMDRVAARRNLAGLFRHQQGLLRLIAPLLTSEDLNIDEEWLEELVGERVWEIQWAEEKKNHGGGLGRKRLGRPGSHCNRRQSRR